MKYSDAGAFRMALEDRLNRQARDAGASRSVARLRKFTAFERLLARLSQSSPEGWVVKGGLALEFRYGERARTTLDLDLATSNQFRSIDELLIRATTVELSDYFEYEVMTVRQLDLEDTNGVQRFTIQSSLAGRQFEALTIDVGTVADQGPHSTQILTSNSLAFAEVEPVTFAVLPLEIQIAEKLHAYMRQYGEGRQSTRVKDLIDIVLIASLSGFELDPLRAAIDATFASRRVQSIPLRLSPPGEHWRRPYGLLAREVGLAEDLDDGYHAAAAFLDPVLDGSPQTGKRWDPVRLAWLPA